MVLEECSSALRWQYIEKGWVNLGLNYIIDALDAFTWQPFIHPFPNSPCSHDTRADKSLRASDLPGYCMTHTGGLCLLSVRPVDVLTCDLLRQGSGLCIRCTQTRLYDAFEHPARISMRSRVILSASRVLQAPSTI